LLDDTNSSNLKALRLNGYKFISPLLFCDAGNSEESTDQKLENKIKQLVDKEVESGNVNTASVFFRDIKSGNQVNINPEEKFFPASLHKIPIMIGYLNAARSDPGILSKKITITEPDTNGELEIKPKDFAKSGNTYTVEELIEKMIKYSDNISTNTLMHNIDRQVLDTAFKDLQLSPPTDRSTQDYMTAGDFSYFFRVLYNATYLRRELSEKALNLLSQVDFKEGLVAGVPQGVDVAHKFGLFTEVQPVGGDMAILSKRELHDCGIVYHPDNPYLLCVMTKSNNPNLANVEGTIKNISSLVYGEVDRNY